MWWHRLDVCEGTVKLTDLRIYSASWTLPKLLILRSSGDRFRPQNPRILLNLTVPSPVIFGDEIEHEVRWQRSHARFNSDKPLARLAGKPIRIRFLLKDADLYSIRFR